MSVNQQTLELRNLVSQADTILLTGPSDLDGDSVGSCLALARILATITHARVDVAGSAGRRYAFLPGVESMVPDDLITGPYDVAVVLDGDRRRLAVPVGRAFEAARHQVIIDHHYSSTRDGYTVALIDPQAASTCEIVYRLLEEWALPLDRELATLLYTGVIYDTGGFRHSNTTPATHTLAARLLQTGLDHTTVNARTLAERSPQAIRLLGRVLLEASFSSDGAVVVGAIPLALATQLDTTSTDCEGIVDFLVYTEGVEVAVLLQERLPDVVKLSLRSRGKVNVAALARSLHPSGGGHARAAGVVLQESIATLQVRMPAVLEQAVAEGHEQV